MGESKFSVTAPERAHQAHISLSIDNNSGDQTFVRIGDGTKFTNADDRNSIALMWDLSAPYSGLPIPQGVNIIDARIEFNPSATTADPNNQNDDHRIALYVADGTWNRSTQSPLHPDQGAPLYGAPGVSSTIRITPKVGSGVPSTDTLPTNATTQNTNSGISIAESFGVTAQIPNNHDIVYCTWYISRRDTSATNPDIRCLMYDLYDNDRHFGIKSLVQTSNPIAYNTLSFSSNGSFTTAVTFQFPDEFRVTDGPKWHGFTLEGDWLINGHASTDRVNFKMRNATSMALYPTSSAGSTFPITRNPLYLKPNGFQGGSYHRRADIPSFYPPLSTTQLTTPWQRAYFFPLSNNNTGGWTVGSRKSYGSVGSGADEEFPGFELVVKSFIGTSDYEPDTGNTWLAAMIEVLNPSNLFWYMRGAITSVPFAERPELIINWNQPPVITSTPITEGTVLIPYTYSATATDPETDTLTWYLDASPTGMTIDSSTGVLAWTPTIGQFGVFPVIVRVDDTEPLSDTQSFSITVAFVPQPGTSSGIEVKLKSEPSVDVAVKSEASVDTKMKMEASVDGNLGMDAAVGLKLKIEPSVALLFKAKVN
jgi:hypothetical protein